MNEKITTYIKDFIPLDNSLLAALTQEEERREDVIPSIGYETGRFFGLLVRLMQAERVLEFGTCLGYSTIWLAEALKTTGGALTSIEYDEKFFRETEANLEKAGVRDRVELIQGDASAVIHELLGPFDIVFQDSEKSLYPLMLDRCIDLTRDNGLLIADDALFKAMDREEEKSVPIHEYNEKVFADPRLYSTILPVGDGITLSVKVGSR
jgi:predicted O-methyltransferase YrrM